MPSWVLKAVTQRLIGFLPSPRYWNEWLQTWMTGSYYASFDGHISPFNFLKFSDRLWRWLNDPINRSIVFA